jgi:16S rRNA (uracil1498-N3)-methyltransferase
MNLFYCPDLSQIRFALPEEEARHVVRVMRSKEGDFLYVTDGKGKLVKARIEKADPKACILSVDCILPVPGKRTFHLRLAVAPTKNTDRFEWFLEKATEIGVDEIIPLICEHSERTVFKSARFEKVLIAAMKQSVKAYLPVLHEPVPFREFILKPFPGQRFIAYCDTGKEELLQTLYLPGNDATILVGPEGDFSAEEVLLAKKYGFEPVSLGPSRLRTETAGVLACHTINLLNQM